MPLPEGLKFLQPGWWLVHALSVLFVWSLAYRQGRADERRERRIRELEEGRR
jgi:hypothetical protein